MMMLLFIFFFFFLAHCDHVRSYLSVALFFSFSPTQTKGKMMPNEDKSEV
jgi:hypothetical protein